MTVSLYEQGDGVETAKGAAADAPDGALRDRARAAPTPRIGVSVLNTDQGCQFTSAPFTGMLKAHELRISMDGRGRAPSQRRSGGVNPRYGKSLSPRSVRATVAANPPSRDRLARR